MILVVCGPPGSGKTTLANRLHGRLTARGYDVDVLHSDDFSSRTYEQLYERVEGSAEHWIVDGTFYKREWQERFRRLPNVEFVHVTADLDTCLERNRGRDGIEEKAVHIIYKEFDDPDADLVVDTDERTPEAAVDLVLEHALDWLAQEETGTAD